MSDLGCVSENSILHKSPMLLNVERVDIIIPLLCGETGRKIKSYSIVSDSLM